MIAMRWPHPSLELFQVTLTGIVQLLTYDVVGRLQVGYHGGKRVAQPLGQGVWGPGLCVLLLTP